MGQVKGKLCKTQNTLSLTCGNSANSFPEGVYPTEAQQRNYKYYPWHFNTLGNTASQKDILRMQVNEVNNYPIFHLEE